MKRFLNIKRSIFTNLIFISLTAIISNCAVGVSTSYQELTRITSKISTSTKTSTKTSTYTPTTTLTPTITPTQTNTPSPTPSPTQIGGGYGIFANVINSHFPEEIEKLGIYKIDLSSISYQQISGPEYYMIGMSPDFKDVLVLNNNDHDISDLLIIHVPDGKINRIATNVFGKFSRSAFWYDNGLIAFIGWDNGSKYIYTVNPDGSGLTKLSDSRLKPIFINPSPDENGVCLTGGTFYEKQYTYYGKLSRSYYIQPQENWCIPFDGSKPTNLKISDQVYFSSQSGYYSYGQYNLSNLAIISTDNSFFYTGSGVKTAKEIIINPFQWSPDGELLLAFETYSNKDDTSSYAELSVLTKDGAFLDFPICEGITGTQGTVSWSPDGTQLLMRIYQTNNESHNYLYDLKTKDCNKIPEFLPEGWSIGEIIWGNRYLY